MSNTVLVKAPTGTGSQVQCPGSGQTYVPDSIGQFLADPVDIRFLVTNGFVLCNNRTDWYSCTPAAASANAQFSSAALSNGTKAIAAQPDFARQLEVRVWPGTTAISAGNLALTYKANDGSTQVDNFSLVAAASTNVTQTTSKGVMTVTSQIITALVGGASPAISIGTNATIAVPLNQGAEGIAFFKEQANTGANTAMADEAVGTVGSNGLIAPTTAPAASKTLGFGYTYTSP